MRGGFADSAYVHRMPFVAHVAIAKCYCAATLDTGHCTLLRTGQCAHCHWPHTEFPAEPCSLRFGA